MFDRVLETPLLTHWKTYEPWNIGLTYIIGLTNERVFRLTQ